MRRKFTASLFVRRTKSDPFDPLTRYIPLDWTIGLWREQFEDISKECFNV